MRLTFFGIILLFTLSASPQLHAYHTDPIPTNEPTPNEIKWYSWDEAVELNKKTNKMIFIDIYTDWCGWCKVMDKKTFTNADVVKYMNENFIAVKFDAEQKETINFQGNEFKHVEAGRNGIHTLAYSLLDGKMSYPAFVLLTEDYKRLGILNGFMDAEKFLYQLKEYMKAYQKS